MKKLVPSNKYGKWPFFISHFVLHESKSVLKFRTSISVKMKAAKIDDNTLLSIGKFQTYRFRAFLNSSVLYLTHERFCFIPDS